MAFQKRLEWDAEDYGETMNKLLKSQKDGKKIHFEFPLDPGLFTSAGQSLVKNTIESIWKFDQFDLGIIFQTTRVWHRSI